MDELQLSIALDVNAIEQLRTFANSGEMKVDLDYASFRATVSAMDPSFPDEVTKVMMAGLRVAASDIVQKWDDEKSPTPIFCLNPKNYQPSGCIDWPARIKKLLSDGNYVFRYGNDEMQTRFNNDYVFIMREYIKSIDQPVPIARSSYSFDYHLGGFHEALQLAELIMYIDSKTACAVALSGYMHAIELLNKK